MAAQFGSAFRIPGGRRHPWGHGHQRPRPPSPALTTAWSTRQRSGAGRGCRNAPAYRAIERRPAGAGPPRGLPDVRRDARRRPRRSTLPCSPPAAAALASHRSAARHVGHPAAGRRGPVDVILAHAGRRQATRRRRARSTGPRDLLDLSAVASGTGSRPTEHPAHAAATSARVDADRRARRGRARRDDRAGIAGRARRGDQAPRADAVGRASLRCATRSTTGSSTASRSTACSSRRCVACSTRTGCRAAEFHPRDRWLRGRLPHRRQPAASWSATGGRRTVASGRSSSGTGTRDAELGRDRVRRAAVHVPGDRAAPGQGGRSDPAQRRAVGAAPLAADWAARDDGPVGRGRPDAEWQDARPDRPSGSACPPRSPSRQGPPSGRDRPCGRDGTGGTRSPRWRGGAAGSLVGHVRSHPRPAEARRRRARAGRDDPRPLRGQGPAASPPSTSARSTRRPSPATTRSTSARASTTTSSRS